MEIKWHGNTSFSFKGENTTLVINPEKDGLEGEIVLSSLQTGLKNVDGQERLFDWPGEYEMKTIPIIGFEAYTKSKSEDEESNDAAPTVIFYFEIDGIKCCHLGELGHAVKSEVLKELSDVDVLMVKAGGSTNLTVKKADEIIEAIDPRLLIVMGDDQADFLKELGILDQEAEKVLKIKAKSLPEDDRKELRMEAV